MTAGPFENAAPPADAEALLAAARSVRAAGPGPDVATLRSAYLDLLKLCLCDLAGTTTTSVGAMPDGTVMARELHGDGRRLRAAGMDWPLQGLTMVGLDRLDDLQRRVEQVVQDGVKGDVIEAGAWRGGASLLMRATLDSLGDDRTVWVADSFEGFHPASGDGGGATDLSAFDFLAVPLEEVRETFARFGFEHGVEFVQGFFEETLAGLAGRRWAIVRLDADTYEPTRAALRALYPGLAAGGYLIVDDYGSFEGCRRAVDEFRREHDIDEPLERVDFTCARWRRSSDEPLAIEPAPAPRTAARQRPGGRPRTARVPTAREVELVRELAELRERLATTEAQIGLRPWLLRKLRRGAAR
jgi:O-methyltransferase